MNPNSNESAGLSLPSPVYEAPQPGKNEEDRQKNVGQPELLAPLPQILPVDPVVPLGSSMVNPDPPTSAQTTIISPLSPTGLSLPAVADDGDIIEKEWVTKAKKLVESTKSDPYTQTREVNRFKADYMKKRYNRDIKTVEE